MCLTIICSLIRCSSAAAKEAPLRSRAGQLDGMDSLLHWGDGQLDLARSTFLPGSPLVLSASWVDGSAWQACTWTLPGGEVWRLEDGQVVDETGDEVEGAESWGDSQAVCGIRISTSLEQVGHCTMTYAMSIDILEVYKSKNSLHAHFILKRIHSMLVIIRVKEAMLATNSGLTKLILHRYVVRTDRDLTNYVKGWNSII